MAEWSYGVTTCPQRLTTLLPRTLCSLAAAGFDRPMLFLDGPRDGLPADTCCGLELVHRSSGVGAYGNWLLTTWEIYIRKPQARFYAVFQDDLVMCRGVREYLEQCEWPARVYRNLFTFSTNENKVFGKPQGWHRSDQLGKGAVALVFTHEGVVDLLKQEHTVNKPQLPKGNKNIDGAVQRAMVVGAKYTEQVHQPSLVQHTGIEGTLGNPRHPQARTFPGEQYNVLGMIR